MQNKISPILLKLEKLENQIMVWNQKKSIKALNFSLVVLTSFVGILLLNLAQPIFGDDWGYSLVGGSTNQRITNFGEILSAQYAHYFGWGGRSVVHVIAQFLLMIDEKWADLLNSLIYVLFTLVIYRIAIPSKNLYPSILIIINLLICIFQVSFGSTVLWITGSANYLWGTLIILLFLMPYVNEYRRNKEIQHKDSLLKSGLFFLFGIIAGWTNENMSVALILMLLALIYLNKLQDKSLPKWAILGFIGACIGCLVMLLAPGNFVRYETSVNQTGQDVSIVTLLFGKILSSIFSFHSYSLGLIVVFILLAILSSALKDESRIKKGRMLASIFFIGGIIATLAMAASPIFPGRASFGVNALMITAIILLLGAFDFDSKVVKRFIPCLAILGLLFYIPDYSKGYKELSNARSILDHRLDEIAIEKQKNNLDITLHGESIEPQTRYLHYYELRPNIEDWHNEMFAKYHQLDSIKFIRK